MKNKLLILLLCLFFARGFSQQPNPLAKTYTYLIYHKLAPGYTIQDAIPIEREWKVLNQAAVDEGNLIGWHMMVKQMSSNPNPAEYDYITVMVSSEMALKGASPAARAKIYGDSVQARLADLQKRDRATAPVVKMEIWETVDAVFVPGFTPEKSPIVVLDLIRLRDPAADWASLVSPTKRLAADRVKSSQLGGWSLSALKVPNGSEKGYSLAVIHCAATMNAALSPDLAGSTMPAPEAAKLRTQQLRTFDVVRQEVFRLTEYTIYKRPVEQAGR
ncbi:hypothetical protein GCM10023187_15000 [Nibrella viscosa]|uniref:Soil-associated protein, TIGR03435 family n=1 Tax=Nibrella viscosa TaxID=1084524 RepID=A0ABP8K6I9_9BACT